MKLVKYLFFLAVTFCVASCGTLSKSDPYKLKANLELRASDLELCGETEISCEYDTYLGFIRHLNKVNGEVYQPGDKKMLSISQAGLDFKNRGMRLAAAKVREQFPEACYFQVVMQTKQTDVLFLGGTTKRTAKVRAYKLK